MRKYLFVVISVFIFFLGNSNVNAQTLGVGLFCNKNVYSKDDKIVTYEITEYDGSKYVKGDEVICYLSVLYDGDVEIKKANFSIISNDNFKFEKFEKSSLWSTSEVDEEKITLFSEKGITGNFVVGKIYYTMMNDGDDLALEVSALYLNDTDVVNGNVSDVINDSTKQEKYPIKQEPVEETKDSSDDEKIDKDLIIYILIGAVVILLLINILQFLIIRKMNKVY